MNSNTRDALKNYVESVGVLVTELGINGSVDEETRQEVLDAGAKLCWQLDTDETIS